MSEVYDVTMPCLCCNETVLLRMEVLSKMAEPVAFCPDCYAEVWCQPWGLALANFMYLVRSQLAEAGRNIKSLFNGFQQIEEALVTEPA